MLRVFNTKGYYNEREKAVIMGLFTLLLILIVIKLLGYDPKVIMDFMAYCTGFIVGVLLLAMVVGTTTRPKKKSK